MERLLPIKIVRASWGHIDGHLYVTGLLYERRIRIGPLIIAWKRRNI